jgi:UDP-glucose 4-epimerase
VSDLADAHLKALEALGNHKGILTCNLGTGTGSSVLDVIRAFEKISGITIPHEFVARRTGDVTEAWADPSLAEKVLGWKAKYSLEEMLADAWNWQQKNPNGYE